MVAVATTRVESSGSVDAELSTCRLEDAKPAWDSAAHIWGSHDTPAAELTWFITQVTASALRVASTVSWLVGVAAAVGRFSDAPPAARGPGGKGVSGGPPALAASRIKATRAPARQRDEARPFPCRL